MMEKTWGFSAFNLPSPSVQMLKPTSIVLGYWYSFGLNGLRHHICIHRFGDQLRIAFARSSAPPRSELLQRLVEELSKATRLDTKVLMHLVGEVLENVSECLRLWWL